MDGDVSNGVHCYNCGGGNMMPKHFVSASCLGEYCNCCGEPATHKVAEVILHDDPVQIRHEYTAYICCGCFQMIMGPAVVCEE